VDGNILRAVVEQAAVGADDVVLEVGAAGGLLTRPLLQRARAVHAFEIDRRYLPRLEALAAQDDRLLLHAGDALKADLAALDPPPSVLAANLAYNIAIPLIMTTIAELPGMRRWAVMLQRELADRLFAAPSTKAYAAVSVLTQLACRLERARPVPPSAFRPRPRVESCFVTFERLAPGALGPPAAAFAADPEAPGALGPPAGAFAAAPEAVAALVRLAFGHRRKVLTNTLPGAAVGGAMLTREDVREALAGVGASPAARPEELSPPQWATFAAALVRPGEGARARDAGKGMGSAAGLAAGDEGGTP
jgi:16S rRNA (adenine1518-N6/adenine1519-N6)-dimethyltransferase